MTKFGNDWIKILDFLIKNIFLGESESAWATAIYSVMEYNFLKFVCI